MVVVDSDAQAFQQFLSDSFCPEREVFDLAATEANKSLGDPEESCLIIDESGILKMEKSQLVFHGVGE